MEVLLPPNYMILVWQDDNNLNMADALNPGKDSIPKSQNLSLKLVKKPF